MPALDGGILLSRLKIMEHFAQKASIEYLSSFNGPILDSLPNDMIDTGSSKSYSSSTNADLGEIDSQPANNKSSSQDTDKKSFTWRGRKKATQTAG